MAKNTNREVVKLGIRTWNWPLYQQEEQRANKHKSLHGP